MMMTPPILRLIPLPAPVPVLMLMLMITIISISSSVQPASTVFVTATKDTEEIRCVTEWGLPPSHDASKMTIIPKAQINDGYCDCIYSGLDESNTSACAGLVTGTAKAKEILFQCPQQPTLQLHLSRINDGICDCCDGADEIIEREGIGTTTKVTNHCEDNCASVLAAFRAEQKQRQGQYQKGKEARAKMITSYQTMINTTKTKIKQLTHDITERTKRLQDKYVAPLSIKQMQYASMHATRIFEITHSLTGIPHDQDRFTKNAFTFLLDLSRSELETLIVYTCQLAGEIMSSVHTEEKNNNIGSPQQTPPQKTCVPMRLAAIETGDFFIMSQDQDATIEFRRSSQGEKYPDHIRILSLILADIYDYNSKFPNHPIFMEEDYNTYKEQLDTGSTKSSHQHSNDKDDDDDDDAHEDYEADEYESHDHADGAKNVFVPMTVHEDTMTYDEHAKFQRMVQESPLSKSRQTYLERSKTLEQRIQEEIRTLEQQQKKTSEEQQEELVLADEIFDEPSIDNSEEIQRLQKILEQLRSRATQIEQGYNYGISAHKLLSSITEETMTFRYEPEIIFGAPEKNMKPSVNDVPLFHRQYLQQLFILTLYYSELSAQQLYEILRLSVAPPVATTESEEEQPGDEQQCTLPYSHICPPTSVLKESLSVPKFIYDEIETFCNTLSMDGNSSSSSIAETSTCAAVDTIPESIPDGYFGYYPVMRREENDPLAKLLDPLGTDAKHCTDDEIRTRREMREVQATVTQYHINLRNMEKTVQEMKESIQNTDSMDRIDNTDEDNDDDDSDDTTALPKYGIEGELHSMKDKCYDFTQGKYKYEICLYQGSLQKDIESSDAGTSLGQWTGAYMERVVENQVEYYERIWKWENGAQCWNGPQRSITAHVNRCGPITKIISANEPDTCRYVVEVESPVACDTAYQQRYGLE